MIFKSLIIIILGVIVLKGFWLEYRKFIFCVVELNFVNKCFFF